MEQNGMTREQEAIDKLNAFKNKLNSEVGVNPLDVLNEKGNGKGKAPVGKQRGRVQKRPQSPPPGYSQHHPGPAPGPAPQPQQPAINPTALVLGTSLINIFERFGKALTPSEEAALLTVINERCPWYIKRLNDIRQAQMAAAAQQQQDRGFEPEPDDTGEDNEDDDDGNTEYVPFKDDEDDGANIG